MLEMRKLIIEGHSYNEIQDILGLSKRTFYRYLQHIFATDKRALEAQNTEQLMFHMTILENRYNSIYRELSSIATDRQQTAEDRMTALHAMASLSLTISKLHRDAPVISVLQARKLKALKDADAPLYFRGGDDSLFLPSIYRGGARPLPPFAEAAASQEQEQQEEELEQEEENGDVRDEEQERPPRDHW